MARFVPVPESVDVGGKRLTVPATPHEQDVIEQVTSEFGDQMRDRGLQLGIDLWAFVIPQYRRVITPDELEQRRHDGLGLD